MDFQINEDLSTYSAEELASLIEAGNARLDEIFADTPTPALVVEAQDITAKVTRLVDHQASLASAGDDMAALRAEREAAAAAAEAAANGGADDGADDPDDGDDPDDEDDPDADDADKDKAAADAVVAAGRKQSARKALAGRKPAKGPAATQHKPVTLTAAADVSGFATGANLGTLLEAGAAIISRVKSFPTTFGIEGAQMQRYGVAHIRKDFDRWADGGTKDIEVFEEAGKESALEGGNLIAAGGWCSPSETIYDLCGGETTEGLLDLPEVGVKRGGIRFTSGPDFSTIYSSSGFTQTEAQNIANTSKGCYTVPCPPFTEVRLDAVGLCIKAGLLQNAAWPELTKRVTSGGLIAHQHRVSASLINKMVTASGAAIAVANMGSVASTTLAAVELVTENLREIYRLGLNQTLEVVLPVWVRGALRADLAHRNGVDLINVTDAQLATLFATRRVRIQWVYNWQMLAENAIGYPSTVQFMAYPAGSFVRGSADVISLDAVYDAAGLDVNTYTGLFFEEGVLLAQQCYKSKLVTIPVNIIGRTGPNTAAAAEAAVGVSFNAA